MERRALIAVAISLLILVVYQELILKRLYPPPPPGAVPEASAPAEPDEAPVREPGESAPPQPAPPARVAPANARDIVVETDLYRAVFSTAGARLKSVRLARYRAAKSEDSASLELIQDVGSDELPLAVELRGEGSADDAGTVYDVDQSQLQVTGDEVASLTFTGRVDGALVTKRFEFRGHRYLFGLKVDATEVPPRYTQMALEWTGLDTGHPAGHEILYDHALALQGPKLRREAFADVGTGVTHEGNIAWVALSGGYFLTAMIPDTPPENNIWAWMKRRAPSDVSMHPLVEAQLLFPPGMFSADLDVYAGPKDIDLLKDAGHSLDRAVDLGWFTFVALPLLHILRLSHSVTGNYGLDIILLTVVIKMLFFPLTQKSFKSMQEMQKLQPEMAKIRERFKDKPDEMNRQVMELYRRNKVNPLSGCLPMILQLPVFVGLYQALLNAVELRHAPFFGWISDLSAPDRLGALAIPFVEPPGIPVLTVLMGVSMLIQQWMTPAQGDPTQQKIMMLMPVMFTFMFLNFPAGLTLYWLVNNVLTIGQQYFLIRASRPAR